MLVDAVKNVPYMWEDYWPVYIAMVCMLAALYVMQLQWAVGIVRSVSAQSIHKMNLCMFFSSLGIFEKKMLAFVS